ncbi:TCR/Tet family MFS transporter [Sandaracinobacteroides saxicola]|uniref:TCR/Tet family MFS transporter n=1 Tax=Sandaracinobacteroides saxicola TaxID=2759707 RepID=A0A7G5IHQ6_9SPHN|nr:TCR/Tet family MFS transporter [Sandaracinobacteroides saxicola]QMW22898.1 TCR/Tet family MFS transporter [Sandaracinobacteroides saxicola]
MPRNLPLTFIVLTVLLDSIGFGIVIPVFPSLITDLTGKGLAEAATIGGWLGMAYAVIQFLFAPVMGNLSDRFGRKPVLLACLAAFTVDYLIAAFAPSIGWLLLARLIAGITGASFSVAYAYIADITPPAKRAETFGLLSVAFGIGFIVGPALGGLVAAWGVHAPFLLAAGLAALNFLLGALVLPESLSAEKRRPFDWRRANPLGALKQVRALGGAIGWIAVGLFAWFIAHQSLQGLWNFYASYRYGWGAKEVGWSLTAVGVGSVLVQWFLIKRAIARLGERRTALLGIVCGVIAFTLYGAAFVPWIGLVGIVFGSIAGMAYPSIQAMMSMMTPEDAQGELQGAMSALSSLAVIIGPPLMTQLFALFSGAGAIAEAPGVPYFLAAALAAFTFLMVRRAPPVKKPG